MSIVEITACASNHGLTCDICLREWGLFTPVTYLADYALSSGAVSRTFSFQIIAIFNAGSCIGRWAPGYLADRFGRFNIMILMILLCMSSTLGTYTRRSSALKLSDVENLRILITLLQLYGFHQPS